MTLLSSRSRFLRRVLFASIPVFFAASAYAAASEITSTDKRRRVVETATKLATPGLAAPLPDDLALPFSPPGFGLSDADERAAAAAANGKSAGPKALSDREVLEQIASQIPPSGTIFVGDEARLIFRNNSVKIGAHFTVNLNGQPYDLELIKIDRTTFTLRLNREEITRPINPAKSQ
ncbi:MAG: hypothetical protein ABIZ81_05215 [Opitutaceae bacterium]